MRASPGYLLGLALISRTCARELTQNHGLRRRAEAGVLDAGISAVRGICDPLVSECTSNDMQIKEELAAALGSKAQVTAVGNIELAELLCDSLDQVLESTLLRFAISSTETVIAERVYFKVMAGDASTDGKDRKVWIGNVIDPAPSSGTTASTISLAWTEPCDVGSLFLKMVTRLDNGSTDVLTSMSCDAGTSTEVCLVETNAVFKGTADPRKSKRTSDPSRRSLKDTEKAVAGPSTRKLQTKAEIDVLVFYTAEAMAEVFITSSSDMETLIKFYFAEANLGNDNSEILLEYNVVHVMELPYTQEPGSDDALTTMTHSAAVSLIRNEFGADLVHLVGTFEDTCGLANFFDEDSFSGFGLTSADCMDDLTIGHEIGHNLGCDHDRDTVEDEFEDHAYAYGKRYCNGTDPYVTIMSYTDDCGGGYVNFYSNPDVTHLDKPTGTATEDCARRITEIMDTVAAYRETGGGGCVSTEGACTSTSDCCDSTCVDGVCGSCIYGVYRGDGGCDKGINTVECGWDDGDCCECSSTATSTSSDDYFGFNCLDPDPQCLNNCAGTWDYINDDWCDEENNNEDCRWDGGDCCEFSCDADHADDCNPEGGEYNCLEVCDPDTSVCPDGTICCPDKQVCEEPLEGTDPSACGDPHMTGFLGQKFDFTGDDGEWYCLISDLPHLHMNMRVTSPLPEVPVITYITGLAVLTTDGEGVDHSIVITVKDPHSLESTCLEGGVSPCLADGALSVTLDGEETLLGPGSIVLGEGVAVSAVNLPGPCRTFGFEQYWERKKLENALHGRRLQSKQQTMGEWIIGDPTVTNRVGCMEYIAHAEAQVGGLFSHQSEHATFQIQTPKATIRLSHGRLHQVAMRDPTDQVDLPDHLTWQMNMGIDHNEVSRAATGILGETFVPTTDNSGERIMSGMDSIRGKQDDYRVEGPLEIAFAQGAYTS